MRAQIAGSAGAIAAALLAGLPVPAARASISGVCPDGSIFVVQRREAIPCSAAKEVEPHDLPPLKPGLLPRPFAWERFQRRRDPNNPYNAMDGAATLRPDAPPPLGPTRARASAPPAPPAPVEPTAPALGLSERELRDLLRIVELAQARAPATFGAGDAEGEGLVVRVAQSRAFEPRLRAAFGAQGGLAGGPVVLFSATAARSGRFHAQLTFVQGHVAFHPDGGDPRELGVLRGGLGELAAGESVLGYAVLPAEIDLARPLDIYWNDRLLTATLSPG